MVVVVVVVVRFVVGGGVVGFDGIGIIGLTRFKIRSSQHAKYELLHGSGSIMFGSHVPWSSNARLPIWQHKQHD